MTTLQFGEQSWSINVPEGKRVAVQGGTPQHHTAAAPELLRHALINPVGLNITFAQAVVPDDRIVVVIDDSIPQFTELLTTLLQELVLIGVAPASMTLLVPQTSATQPWLDDLPDELGDIQLERHDPADPKKLSYLASTTEGRRVYMNRTLAEADVLVVLGGRRFDPVHGNVPGGAELQLFPAYSNKETQAEVQKQLEDDDNLDDVLEEAKAVTMFLGLPYFVQVIEGSNNTVADVLFGLPPSTAEGEDRQLALWERRVQSDAADLAVVTIRGTQQIGFVDLSNAIQAAREVLAPDAPIVLLCAVDPEFDSEVQRIVRADTAADAAKSLVAVAGEGNNLAALQWTLAANNHPIFLRSNWPDATVEDLFAVTLESNDELQKFIDRANRVVILEDAHLVRVVSC
jgi:Lactate racemase N-terminal domain